MRGFAGGSLPSVSRSIRLGLPGVIIVTLGWMAAAGRLPRNVLAGIRIPSTMRSDEAWLAGHRAAASALTAAGLGPIALGVVAGVWKPAGGGQKALSRIGAGWLLGWIGVAIARADKAARTVPTGA